MANPFKSDFDNLTKLTEKREAEMVRELNKAYNDSYKAMKNEIRKYTEKMKDGKLNTREMYKFDRLEKMIKNVEDELKKVENLQSYQVKTFLKDSYELNYYYTGFALENRTGAKLNFAILDRKQVKAAIENPLMNIAIEENKKATRQRIRRELTQAVVKGDGIQKAAQRISRATEIGANRAVTIVRTETTKVMSNAREEGFKKASRNGVEVKEQWRATLDDRTRDSHASMDGEITAIGEEFSNGLEKPGDSSGPAEEVVNCRCTVVAYVPEIRDMDLESEEFVSYDDWKRQRLHKK